MMVRWLLLLSASASSVSAAFYNHYEALGLACAISAKDLFSTCHDEDYGCYCSSSLYVYAVESCIARQTQYNSTKMGLAFDRFDNDFCERHGAHANSTDVWGIENQLKNPTVSDKAFNLAFAAERNNMSQKEISAWLGVGMIFYWVLVVLVVFIGEQLSRFFLRLSQYRVVMQRPPKLVRWAQRRLFWPAVMGTRHMSSFQLFNGWVSFSCPTRFETVIVALYFLLGLILMLTPYTFMNNDPLFTTRWKEMMRYASDRSGIIATVQFPLLILFALRNNILIWLTGWSYSTFNTYHRAVARITYLLLVIHAIMKHIFSASYGGSLVKYYYPVPYFRWGCAAIGLFSLMIIFAIFRARGYEVFYRMHQAMALGGIICSHYHLNGLGFKTPLWISFALWGADWLIRVARIILFNMNFVLPPLPGARRSTFGTARVYEGEMVRITITTPVRWIYQPGQYVFLHTNRWSLIGGHPFSVVGPSELGEGLEILVKAREGMTRRLFTKLDDRSCTPEYPVTIPVYVEGPYGVSAPVERYEEGLIFAGGIGITGVLGYVEKLAASNKPGDFPKKVRLFWAIRSRTDIDPVAYRLAKLAAMEGVEIRIFQRKALSIVSPTSDSEAISPATIMETDGPTVHFGSDAGSSSVGKGGEAIARFEEVPFAVTQDRASKKAAASLNSRNFHTSTTTDHAAQEVHFGDDDQLQGRSSSTMDKSRRASRPLSRAFRLSSMEGNHKRTKSEMGRLRRSIADFVTARNPEDDDKWDYGKEDFLEDQKAREFEDTDEYPIIDQKRKSKRISAFASRPRTMITPRTELPTFVDAGLTDVLAERRMTMINPFADKMFPYAESIVDERTKRGWQDLEKQELCELIEPVGMDVPALMMRYLKSSEGSVCIVGCGPDRMMDTLCWSVCQFLELAENGRVDYFEEAFKW